MRVALLSHNAAENDAIGNQVAEKLSFFQGCGAEVRVFVESQRNLHPALRDSTETIANAQLSAEQSRYLQDADLIVAEYGHSYLLLGLLPLWAGTKPKILFDYHGVTPAALWESSQRERMIEAGRNRGLVWCANRALVHSQFASQELIEATGYPAERIDRLGHPIDTDFWAPGEPLHNLRAKLGIEAEPLLLYVGRIAPNKRISVLIEAVARLRSQYPKIQAAIVGDHSDLYAEEMRRCVAHAEELEVRDCVHFLGQLSTSDLRDAYRSADVLVMPSLHEGFCIPVIEAMACGLPVIAARAGALPETVGDAGLTFCPDSVGDLARQIRRVLDTATRRHGDAMSSSNDLGILSTPHPFATSPRRRIAVVAYRYGPEFVGGAETSLRIVAQSMRDAGHFVEVYTTCTRRESGWHNDYPAGTVTMNGIPVRRFPVDPHHVEKFQSAVRNILETKEPAATQAEAELVAQSIHSKPLLEALQEHADSFDAIIVGPYGVGLTYDVAKILHGKTLLLPCFHDEKLARLSIWRMAYEQIGGILYHTAEEQSLAEISLGVNHPRAQIIGTVIDVSLQGDPRRGRQAVRTEQPYIVYCGRYSREKGLSELLDWCQQYAEGHSGGVKLVCMGEGNLRIPSASWVCDLGFVEESVKRDVLAGAAALVQLSRNESLSLVALEAWSLGVPVVAHRRCPVLAGHMQRSGAGSLVDNYAGFAAALDDLWQHPEIWREQGQRGQAYAQGHYADRDTFTQRLIGAVDALREPLVEKMRQRGRQRAESFSRQFWRTTFADLVEQLLDAPTEEVRQSLAIEPRSATRTVTAGSGTALVPVRVINHGSLPALAEGPARVVLRAEVNDSTGCEVSLSSIQTPLPALLNPGQSMAAVIRVVLPVSPGNYEVRFFVDGATKGQECAGKVVLILNEASEDSSVTGGVVVLDQVQAALAEADQLQRLPDDYLDVTEGWFAAAKRWLKRKLLGNFKRGYVDVLSRQQTAFNRQLLTSVQELAECCATLDHAMKSDSAPDMALRQQLQRLRKELIRSRRRCAKLAARLTLLERQLETRS